METERDRERDEVAAGEFDYNNWNGTTIFCLFCSIKKSDEIITNLTEEKNEGFFLEKLRSTQLTGGYRSGGLIFGDAQRLSGKKNYEKMKNVDLELGSAQSMTRV